MSLLDVLNGMQNGPRGQVAPGEGGMSKTTMALLALLAYKAYKSITGGTQVGTASYNGRAEPAPDDGQSGGLAAVLRGIFGGGPLPPPVLRRGLDNTVRDLDRVGHGDTARSWISRGANRSISPSQVGTALGEDGITDLMDQTGMNREDLLQTLSEYLPRVIDHLTPEGRLPTEDEARRFS